MIPNAASWLGGLFGGRRVVGCKESSDALYQGMAAPLDPNKLLIDKRLDVVLYQPFFVQQQVGIIDTMNSWGRPMDAPNMIPGNYYNHPAPYYQYPNTHLDDGTATSSPLRVGTLVRNMAAGAMNDVRSLRIKRN
jgi:hypothetical protein